MDDLQRSDSDEDEEFVHGSSASSGASVSDDNEEPPIFLSPRRCGVSAEVYGAWNRRRTNATPVRYEKGKDMLKGLDFAMKACPFFSNLEQEALDALIEAMPVETAEAGSCIVRQGDFGDSGFVVLSGSVECYNEEAKSSEEEFVPMVSNSLGETAGGLRAGRRGAFVRTMPTGRFFGEKSMLWNAPRSRSIYAKEKCTLAKLHREVYQNLVVRREMNSRERRENCLRQVPMLETLSDEQVACIADTLERRVYEKDDQIVTQGDEGNEFYVVLCGECVVTVETGSGATKDIQEHRRYNAGEMFGERALLQRTTRAATITARSRVEVLCLRRNKFERMLGPLQQLAEVHYRSDPRKNVADFYRPGDSEGPHGAGAPDRPIPESLEEGRSDWFAVYRPTSRDAIAKMLSGVAVGKGLNVKGKSAKKNRLSGYVPFLQISSNAHKNAIERPDAKGRIKVFFHNDAARGIVMKSLSKLLSSEEGLTIADRNIYSIEHQSSPGLDVPEPVIREAYIMRCDITFLVGWETGRKSEPAFMDMNMHAVRGGGDPEVVLYQHDHDNPMNPHGLLIAYAELTVRPVVSDFDTFLVGSRGVRFAAIAPKQQEVALWSLEKTVDILRNPGGISWNSRWLDILREANTSGFHPDIPKYGFGDTTSIRLIEAAIKATVSTGAVRHGAECFNYYFPQELDEEYLVVWEGFEDKPWDYKDEDEMRDFLEERIEEGYNFPLNPVWPLRDRDWYDVFQLLHDSDDPCTQANFKAWYPPESGITDIIVKRHEEFPDGFTQDHGEIPFNPENRTSTISDLDMCERADLAYSLAEMDKGTGRRRSSTWPIQGGMVATVKADSPAS